MSMDTKKTSTSVPTINCCDCFHAVLCALFRVTNKGQFFSNLWFFFATYIKRTQCTEIIMSVRIGYIYSRNVFSISKYTYDIFFFTSPKETQSEQSRLKHSGNCA